jgi:hypothetical protein
VPQRRFRRVRFAVDRLDAHPPRNRPVTTALLKIGGAAKL